MGWRKNLALKMKTNSLYIHIPFCKQICFYCDFCKVFYDEKQVDQYLQVLKKELAALKISDQLKTIYIGGGTPSALNYQQLSLLFDLIKPYISKETKEITIEVNPETIDETKMQILKAGGVNRLSIGVETFDDQLLAKINRHHQRKDVLNVIELAKKYQIDNISIDLMYGLPDQSIDDAKKDLQFALNLEIKHISYYALILEKRTVLNNLHYQPLDEETELMINKMIDEQLCQAGFNKYEISNFAKTGYQSLHNLAYWHYDNYYGIGLGASGKIDDCLYEHNRNLTAYLKGENTLDKIVYSKEETMFNHLMMSLRLIEGLNLKEFEHRYQQSIFDVYDQALNKHLNLKTLVIEDDYLRCNKEAIYLLNDILLDFL